MTSDLQGLGQPPAAAPSTNLIGKGGKTRPKPLTSTPATTFADATTSQVVLVTQNGTGLGLLATAPSNTGLEGVTSGTGTTTFAGVYGLSNGATGAGKGVIGQSNSTTGVGVYALETATTGLSYGLLGTAKSTSGVGIQGQATATTGNTIGLFGLDYSTTGIGLSGQNNATSGATIGVQAKVFSASGIAMVVDNTAGGKILSGRHNGAEKFSVDGLGNMATSGSVGIVASTTGVTALNVQATELTTANTAIQGVSDGTNGTGVIGQALNGANATGVWGISSSGLAGEFSGNVSISGSISKSSGSFKIDDPLDPANKYLYHSFVESPDMKNIYDGVATLDVAGEAVVSLPAWFEALNRDFRYQLTCIGGFAPVYIAEEIAHNQFKIAGGNPGMKVSWQVTGTRQDAWANAHRIPVEVEKPATERGMYIHPELFGQRPDRAVEWARHPQEMKRTRKAAKSRP